VELQAIQNYVTPRTIEEKFLNKLSNILFVYK
jgi:cob(I)alamin adenosyltransferase